VLPHLREKHLESTCEEGEMTLELPLAVNEDVAISPAGEYATRDEGVRRRQASLGGAMERIPVWNVFTQKVGNVLCWERGEMGSDHGRKGRKKKEMSRLAASS